MRAGGHFQDVQRGSLYSFFWLRLLFFVPFVLCPDRFKQDLAGTSVQEPLKGSTGARQGGFKAVLVHFEGRGSFSRRSARQFVVIFWLRWSSSVLFVLCRGRFKQELPGQGAQEALEG